MSEPERAMPSYPLHQVGPEGFDEWDLGKLPLAGDYCVYWYETYAYEGDGLAAIVTGDTVAYESLGHCSCNGPTDGCKFACDCSVADFLKLDKRDDEDMDRERSPSDHDYIMWQAVVAKVRELQQGK